ncbi:MAG: phage terminase large subunit family protein [Betaproteobacteria bacterium]|nr:phage terminase large subunit family protein [Betaproteobacteria bacterium]
MWGKFEWTMVPQLRAVLDAFNEPGVRGVRVQKGSQGGYTESILVNLLGYIIDVCPAPILVMFPKADKGKEFNLERFEPMIEVTPCLAEKVPLKSREKGITQLFKVFAGGWIKFVGSHTPDAVKSSSARYVFVEEPDDCETDVKGQGRTVKLIRERLKTYFDTMSVMGGTPTLEGLSAIADEMLLTDQRKFFVRCNHCGHAAPLVWENVKWRSDETVTHPVYGHALPETAAYECDGCGVLWSPSEKDNNIRASCDAQAAGEPGVGWLPTAPFTGLAGFYMSDLISLFPGAALPELVKKYLEAQHQAAAGDNNALVEFYNNQLGLPFRFKSPVPEIEELEQRAEAYEEFTVPWGGLRLTAGVDVQGDRLAVKVVAWGRGEESWRVFAGEIYGNVVDHSDPVWDELEEFLFREYRHVSGVDMYIECMSIDASDGNTSDAVYHFARKHKAHGVIAVKGASDGGGEIFRVPKPVDPNSRSKASKYGLQVYMVGTEKAKDLIIGYGEFGGRLKLSELREIGGERVTVTGTGPGRMHWYRGIRGDWFKQITSEVKAPMKGRPRNKLYWQVKQGVRNEFLDCEVYALHAARKLRINLMSDAAWSAYEQRIRQPDMVTMAQLRAQQEAADQAARDAAANIRSGDAEPDAEQDSEMNTAAATEAAPGEAPPSASAAATPAAGAGGAKAVPAVKPKRAPRQDPLAVALLGGGRSSKQPAAPSADDSPWM